MTWVMTEMGGFSRFSVNAFSGRRNARTSEWLKAELRVPDGGSCLEVGCGNGDMARRILDLVRPARYVATDLDPRQVDAARRHLAELYPGGPPAGLELRAANMLSLPFPDASFDAVFAFYSLHHADAHHREFVNVPKALAEVDRVLRPGGAFAYVEIINKDRVRGWLRERGYRLDAVSSRWTSERVLASKPS